MIKSAPEAEVRRKNSWLGYIGVAIISSLLTFAVTWAFTSSRPVSVTFVNPNASSQSTSSASPTSTTSTNPTTSGQVALTEAQLIAAVKSVGEPTYWAGPTSGDLYTFNHPTSGQNFVRYLPNGAGLADVQQNYRVIATYQTDNAYKTMQEAGKLSSGVGITNPDGSLVYYAKATPTHVYLAYKNLPFQIEIFDPAPGAALKLATTPGFIKKISKLFKYCNFFSTRRF